MTEIRGELSRELFDEPQVFDFFQAVRLLEAMYPDRMPVGEFGEPGNEVVRFETNDSVGFPASAIQGLRQGEAGEPPRMTVNFFGLTGPQGLLPLEYSLYLSQRARAGDHAMKEFFSLFDHRMLSLFYRAWSRSRADVALQPRTADSAHSLAERRDWITRHLLDLAGLGPPELQHKLPFDDAALLHYVGLLSLPSRPASALEQLVADYFGVTVEVEQFVGAWYPLEQTAQSALGEGGMRVALGEGAVAGDEIWDQQSRVRIRIGPLARAQYDAFLPGGVSHDELRALTRFFGNDQFDFEVQLVLARDDAPALQLGADDGAIALGWVTWLHSGPLQRDPDDAIFTL